MGEAAGPRAVGRQAMQTGDVIPHPEDLLVQGEPQQSSWGQGAGSPCFPCTWRWFWKELPKDQIPGRGTASKSAPTRDKRSLEGVWGPSDHPSPLGICSECKAGGEVPVSPCSEGSDQGCDTPRGEHTRNGVVPESSPVWEVGPVEPDGERRLGSSEAESRLGDN